MELFPFRYFDELRKKWIPARYLAEIHVIAERYEKWEITGPAEIRSDAPTPWHSTPPPYGEPK